MKKTETKSLVLLGHHLKALKLPTMHDECEKIAGRCAADNADHLAFLLQLCELELIDRLVHGCYLAIGNFRLLASFSMLYFAAATTYEHRRFVDEVDAQNAFLCADDPEFCDVVIKCLNYLTGLVNADGANPVAIVRFEREVAQAIEPFNRAGLCDPSAQNMYRYTAAPLDAF